MVSLQWNTTKLEGIVMIDNSALEIKLVVTAVHDTTILLSGCAVCGCCHQEIAIEHGIMHFSIHLGTNQGCMFKVCVGSEGKENKYKIQNNLLHTLQYKHSMTAKM